jgi:hypothetical protein
VNKYKKRMAPALRRPGLRCAYRLLARPRQQEDEGALGL